MWATASPRFTSGDRVQPITMPSRGDLTAATLLHGPEDMFWGDRYARLVDPYGHHWSLATPGPGPDLEATAVAEAQFDKMLDTP
jgi:hypothetical protein